MEGIQAILNSVGSSQDKIIALLDIQRAAADAIISLAASVPQGAVDEGQVVNYLYGAAEKTEGWSIIRPAVSVMAAALSSMLVLDLLDGSLDGVIHVFRSVIST